MGNHNSVHFSRVAIDAIRREARTRKLKVVIRAQGLMLEIARTDKDTDKNLRDLVSEVLSKLDLPARSPPKIRIEPLGRRLFGSSGVSKRYFKELARSTVVVSAEKMKQPTYQEPRELAEVWIDQEIRSKPKGEADAEEHEALGLKIDFNGAHLRVEK